LGLSNGLGSLRAIHLAHARGWGLALGGAVGLLVFLEVQRIVEAAKEGPPSA